MNDLKSHRISKLDLLSRIRDLKDKHFEVLEPVTAENINRLLPLLRKASSEHAYSSLVVLNPAIRLISSE
jgi:hypothetical protein